MTYQTKLIKQETVAEGTIALHLEKPEGFSFKSGQHIDLAIENPGENDDLGNVRTFSLVSAPHESELVVATRLRDTAFKREMPKLEVGASDLSIDGPFGNMTLHSKSERPAVMLAGGIGITPFISMIRHAVYENLPHVITLLYSNRTRESAAFLSELAEAAKTNEQISLVSTVTGEGGGGKDENRRIDAEMIRTHSNTAVEPVYYLAGPPQFTKAMQNLLEEMGVEDDDVRFEEFAGY